MPLRCCHLPPSFCFFSRAPHIFFSQPAVNPPAPPVHALPPCRYGAACYQQNEAHLSQFSHPEREATAPAAATTKGKGKKATGTKRTKAGASADASASGEQEPCRWGNQCFRTSEDHRKRYSHNHAPEAATVPQAAAPAAGAKKKAKTETQAPAAQEPDNDLLEVSEEADVPVEELERAATNALTLADVNGALVRQQTLLMGDLPSPAEEMVQISAAELKRLRELAGMK